MNEENAKSIVETWCYDYLMFKLMHIPIMNSSLFGISLHEWVCAFTSSYGDKIKINTYGWKVMWQP